MSIKLGGIFSWDELIANDGKESDLAKGLVKLGVLEKPTNTFLVKYLSNLPQNQKLNPQQLKDAKAILVQMGNNINDLDDIAELLDATPLLTRSDQLKTSEQLYIKDLPAYDKSEKKNDQLEFCQNQFEKFAKKCGVISLAENITSSIDLANSKKSGEPDRSWNNYIRSDHFKSAVLRLIYHEGKISGDEIKQESIDEVLPSSVLLMDSLVVKYSIDNIWIYDDIVSSTYHDKEISILYTLNQKDDEDICDSIAKFICYKSDLELDSYSLINRILRHKFDSFDEVHNLLDNKNIKSLPEKIEINENSGLFDPDPIAEEVASSALGNPQSPPPQNEEISPPTKPKTSSPSNIKREEHSSNRHKQSVINSSNGTISTESKRKILSINSKKEIVSSNDRKPVYVGTDIEIEPHENRDQKNLAIEIGNRGEQYILKHSNNLLLSKSNKFKISPTNNEGFDIQEIDASGDIVRYIEVKTLTGRWAEGGVAVTVPQFKFAQEHDNWWLFVVENLNTQNTQVYLLNNPVQKVNRFMFDHSWKQLAEAANIESAEVPENGAKYSLSGVKYEISSIESKGKLYKVILKNIQTGEEMVKKFDPSWERY